jgi:glycolate oxidase iron-sulfur subunit
MDNIQAALAQINHCNKCGFCLPACPTYRLTGNEMDSPRGRIAMVEGVLRDEIAAGEGLERSLSYCLGCRACETACPSGVQYHRILEAGKRALDVARPAHRGMTFLPRTLLKLTKRPRRMRRLAGLARRSANLPLPESLTQFLPMLNYHPQAVAAAPAPAKPIGSGAYFRGCVQEALFHDANQSAVELLRASGVAVALPNRQTCCGALAWHAGRADEARKLARRNIEAFESVPAGPVVNAAGGCGGMLSEYGEILADDRQWARRAERFSQRVKDWTQVLGELPELPPLVGAGERVALQNSCHLINVEGGGEWPAKLIGRVKNDSLAVYAGQDRCCGSAGIYNIQHPDWAVRLLDGKMAELSAQNPDRVLVVNPGCQLQMTMGVHRADLDAPVEHLARYLYRAFRRGQGKAEGLDQIQ